ncbi:MAG: hypothetical protein HYZ92_03190 [Candidatus Omnitrophica bacterium]|nr:hypothetical protein [Candidatus Omnitrophota bacterium]
MKPKMVMMLTLGALLTWSVGEVQAANLLRNPGFENGLNDWTDLFGAPSNLSTTTFHSGALAAVKSVATVTRQDYWSQLYQEIPVAAGNPLYASIFLKTTFDPAATAKGGLIAQFYNASGAQVGSTIKAPDVGGTTNWRLLELSVSAAPTGAVKVRLSAFLWAAKGDTKTRSGQLFIDDAFLDKIVRAVQPKRTLQNPGFENGLRDWLELFGFPSFLSTSPIHSGKYAAGKRVETVSGQDYWSQIYQEVVLAPTQTGTASLWVMTNFAVTSGARAGLFIEFLDSSNRTLASLTSPVIGGQTAWRALSVSWASSPPATKKARLSGFIFAPTGDLPSVGGRAYYDDATLVIQ